MTVIFIITTQATLINVSTFLWLNGLVLINYSLDFKYGSKKLQQRYVAFAQIPWFSSIAGVGTCQTRA